MLKARLLINKNDEIVSEKPVISLGRADDNVIPIPYDSNVSRYHAEIEKRGDEFWLIELGSSNGTSLNGQPVREEVLLQDGDLIVLGGSSKIEFYLIRELVAEEKPAPSPQGATAPPPPPPDKKDSKFPLILVVAGLLLGLGLILAVGAGIYYYTRENKCDATASLVTPEDGELIAEEVEVKAKVNSPQCVQRVVFQIDGEEFASASAEPYSVPLDPAQFPELADGMNHNLNLVVIDKKGTKTQQGEVLLAFETLSEVKEDEPEKPEGPVTDPTPKPTQPEQRVVSAIESQEMAKRLIKQFSGTSAYKFDPQFLQELQKKTAEFAAEGYFARAQQYRDVINVAFVKEQNLDPALGYVLAMSRSRFNIAKQGNEEGLWRMSNDFSAANSLNGMCGTEAIGAPSQICAAKTSSLYMKQLVLNIFEGDTIYAVAAFGMSPGEAVAWKSTLPPNRENFWNVIKSPKQREEVLRFFAAGIVAQNPQKFGLRKDKPLIELYRNIMG